MATKNKNLLRIVERLKQMDRDNVLMFSKMIHLCQQLNVEHLSAEEWDVMPYTAKARFVEILERNNTGDIAYRLLLSDYFEIKNSRPSRGG
ncbi:MAG: hypothetical protein DCC56_09510 [Anaerolineae bacterium]|nr:MAG: hypothetical protein DCC56_09510 [Anaerolineae bacterium]WKZ45175.1 MAG: hypothetical protein QY302_05230 [Anaerolineales bacterium]